jgi:hypothetical protein
MCPFGSSDAPGAVRQRTVAGSQLPVAVLVAALRALLVGVLVLQVGQRRHRRRLALGPDCGMGGIRSLFRAYLVPIRHA